MDFTSMTLDSVAAGRGERVRREDSTKKPDTLWVCLRASNPAVPPGYNHLGRVDRTLNFLPLHFTYVFPYWPFRGFFVCPGY